MPRLYLKRFTQGFYNSRFLITDMYNNLKLFSFFCLFCSRHPRPSDDFERMFDSVFLIGIMPL